MWLTMRSGLNREEQRKDKKQKGNERGQSRLSHWDEEEEKRRRSVKIGSGPRQLGESLAWACPASRLRQARGSTVAGRTPRCELLII